MEGVKVRGDSNSKKNRIISMGRIDLPTLTVLIILISTGLYINTINKDLLDVVVNLINIILVFNIFLITINFYNNTRSSRIIALGVMYSIIGIITFFEILLNEQINLISINEFTRTFFTHQLTRYFEYIAVSFIIAIITKTVNKCMSNRKFYSLFTITILGTIILNKMIDYITDLVPVLLFIPLDNLFLIGIISYMIYSLTRMSKGAIMPIHNYVSIYFTLSFLAEISFVFSINMEDGLHVVGIILKMVSFCFMLKVLNEVNKNEFYKNLCTVNENLKNTISKYRNTNTKLKEQIIENEKNKQEILDDRKILNAILESIEEGIIVMSLHGGREILHWNDRFREMWGVSKKHLREVDIKEIYNTISNQLENTDNLCSRCDEIMKSKNNTYHTLKTTDGRIIQKYVRALIINDEILGKVLCYRDITEQKKAEEELIKSERRNRTLVETLPDGVAIHKDFKIFYGNNEILKLLDAEVSSEVFGRDVLEFLSPEYTDSVKENVENIMTNKIIKSVNEIKIKSLKGKLTEVEASTSKLHFSGRDMLITIMRDISKRRRVERENELNKELLIKERNYDEMKTQFFTNLSHELKTPINVLLGTVQLLDAYVNNDMLTNAENKLPRKIFSMKQNCYRLLRLVNNLTDIVRIESGFLEVKPRNYNIVSIVEEITLSVADYVESRGIQLIFDTNIEDRVIACDPDMIERIMLNLLSNAIKFTQEGGQIVVSTYEHEKEMEIIVEDTGTGIPKDKQKDIFERFKKAGNSLIKNDQGTGIGLSLVKSIVEIHEGSIELESTYGEGSKFSIKLPIKLVTDEPIEEYYTGFTSNIEKLNIEFSDIYS